MNTPDILGQAISPEDIPTKCENWCGMKSCNKYGCQKVNDHPLYFHNPPPFILISKPTQGEDLHKIE